MDIDSLVNYNVIVLMRGGKMNTKLIENRKTMRNIATQVQLIMIIRGLQNENAILRQSNEELQYALEDKIENIDAKKLVLIKSREG